MSNIKLKGSHGCTLSIGIEIEKNGFQIMDSERSRIGRGTYFWGHERYLESLAFSWAKFRCNKPGCEESTATIFFVDLETHEDKFLAIDDDFKEELIELMLDRGMNPEDDEDLTRAHNLLISRIEKANGSPFSVVSGKVSLPPRRFLDKDYPYKVHRQTLCYAVRDAGIISITKKVDIDLL